MREMKITKNDAGQRLDKFLSKALPDLPPSLLYKSIRTKKIKRNRKRTDAKEMLLEGDTLQLFLSEEFFPGDGNEGIDLAHIRPDISVLYEDENILLLNKRPGVTVHEDAEGSRNTLLLHLQAYLYQKGEYDPKKEQSFAPALCNRIDRNTAGIVIAAKNAEALRVMNEKIRLREIGKFYLCAVHGVPNPPRATLSGWLLKNQKDNTVRIYDKNPPMEAKAVKTRYTTLKTKSGLALLEVELLTGRTHQIRAHLAHVGHPLLGDGKYGINRQDRAAGYNHQALCAWRLVFPKTETENALSYLEGKEFRIPYESIYFTEEFC